jgi:hypothetical protein
VQFVNKRLGSHDGRELSPALLRSSTVFPGFRRKRKRLPAKLFCDFSRAGGGFISYY